MSLPELKTAWALIEKGRYPEAEALLRGKATPEARMILGYALAFQGRYKEALALYRALFQETQNPRALHQVGMVLRMAGRLEEALGVFQEEAGLLPEDPLARSANHYEQGYVLLLLGEREESRQHLEAALALAQRVGDAMAEAVAHRGLMEWHLEAARAHRREALRLFQEAQDPKGAEEVERLFPQG